MFRPGAKVWFRSAARGGTWKPGTVAAVVPQGGNGRREPQSLRIETGKGVHVVRPLAVCRPGRRQVKPGRPGALGPNAARAVELDARGLLLREIGALLGISRQRVHQIVKRARESERSQS